MVKVSIIIPVYNCESLLPRCLDSVLEQTLSDIEVVCVDDGSTDGSLAVLKTYAMQDARVKVISQPNSRQGTARNNGMSVATGEYIGFADSDDYVDKEFFERLYDAAVRHGAEIAEGGILKHKSMLTRTVIQYLSEQVFDTAEAKLTVSNCPPDYYVFNKIYSRKLFERKGLRFAEDVQYEDVVFTVRALSESGGLVTVPDATYHYVSNSASTVKSRQTAAKQREKYKAHYEALRYMDSHGISVKPRYRTLTVRHFTACGVCFWKVGEKGTRRVFKLFDVIPLWSWRTKSKR